MQTRRWHRLIWAGGLVLAFLLMDTSAHAADSPEPQHSGWSLYLDNDTLVPSPRDQDYTGGFSLTQAGRAAASGVSLDPVLGHINDALGIEGESAEAGRLQLHARQLGVAIFTPGDMEVDDITRGDRPYSGLVYMASTRLLLDPHQPDTVHQSTLTLGLLGLEVVGELQQELHQSIGAARPVGWEHQISNGGEPTFRYSHAVQHLLASGSVSALRYEVKPSAEAGIGFITDANASLSMRFGRISTPWWSFAPDRSEYFSQPSPGLARHHMDGPRELYVWAGAKAKVRPWNAFLQGQFRDSDLTYGASEVRPVLFEGWLGVTGQISRKYWLSWVLRYQTSELREGAGDRNLLWGSVFINRYY